MLTGDKLETALCICISTGLRKTNEKIFIIENNTDEYELEKTLTAYIKNTMVNEKCMLVVDGASLGLCLNENLKELFLALALKVETVCCCRCSPTQKSKICTYLTKLTSNRILAVGDGGNDVGMIRIANCGVGIKGKEGVQAALASDFSLTEFEHLVK